MDFLTLENLETKNKSVLVRCDLNVPVTAGQVTDLTRIERIIPTINYLKNNHAKIILTSHFGRPNAYEDSSLWDMRFSLKSLIPHIEKLTRLNVLFIEGPISKNIKQMILEMPSNTLALLENLRFYPGEETNQDEFSKKLASIADVFVNEAFSCSHRAHASIVGITKYLPSVAGKNLQRELQNLNKLLKTPLKPFAAIVGGSKVSTKLDLLNNLALKADILVIGGAMANTFLKAQGFNVGSSLFEPELIDTALKILKNSTVKIILPQDVVVATDIDQGKHSKIVKVDNISRNEKIFDIGPQSIVLVKSILNNAKTVVWNGPVGAFEYAPFEKGSLEIAYYLGDKTDQKSCISIAGGGDTLSVLTKAKVQDKFSYISTAGGAFLEWLEGKNLPGIIALRDKKNN